LPKDHSVSRTDRRDERVRLAKSSHHRAPRARTSQITTTRA
jgi:hypothetical protein